MLTKLKQFWNDHGFEIAVALSILFILVGALLRVVMKKNGTWSESLVTIDDLKLSKTKPHYPTQYQRTTKPKDSKGETECRRVLEQTFRRPFDKARPDILNNPVTGGNHNLELDCYNREMRLAVEYNGAQHYKYIPFFHSNKEAFLNQKYRDELKRRMCRDNGITLIEVPYTVKQQDIESFLLTELRKAGYKV